MSGLTLPGERKSREPEEWFFAIGRDARMYLFNSSLVPVDESLQKLFHLICGPFDTQRQALREAFRNQSHYREFLTRRLPHLETMSAEQHALVTLINAACYVSQTESKRLIFDAFRELIGVQPPWSFGAAASTVPDNSAPPRE